MEASQVKLDEIGYWSEIKLEILRGYAQAYSTILEAQRAKGVSLSHYYIDAFAGAGKHVRKGSREVVPGSPANALLVTPPFKGYFLIDLKRLKVQLLKELAAGRRDVEIFEGDCNAILLKDVFPRVRYEDFRRGLCILDPYGLHLDWEVMQTAGKMRSLEIFLNFPIMDMNMNVLKRDAGNVDPLQRARLNAFWGDESWVSAAYETESDLFGDPLKTTNEAVIQAFKERLKKVAGFRFVPEPLAMKNQSGAVVYYLFFASHNEAGSRIANDLFAKYRKLM